MKTIILSLLLASHAGVLLSQNSPDSLTLDTCYALAEQHYPLVRQRELIARSREYTLSSISRGSLPQVSIMGQATYQSDVTQLPISLPGMDIPVIPKDQFRIYGEINQPLTDLITIRQNREAREASIRIQEQNLEAELYQVKERINQLFFGVLLLDGQIRQSELFRKDITTAMARVQAAIDFGTELQSNLDKLKAELLKAEQRTIELKAGRAAFLSMLGMFTGQPLEESTALAKPARIHTSDEIRRPELKVFDLEKHSFDIQSKLITTRNLPKFGLFFQGGFGRPSPVNLFTENLEPYYIGGLRLNWSLSSFYTSPKERELIAIGEHMTDARKETFLFNTRLSLEQIRNEVERLRELVRSDEQIIALRTSVKEASHVQLENGVITVNDFLREANAEDLARQSKVLHEIQLLMAQHDYRTTAGF